MQYCQMAAKVERSKHSRTARRIPPPDVLLVAPAPPAYTTDTTVYRTVTGSSRQYIYIISCYDAQIHVVRQR